MRFALGLVYTVIIFIIGWGCGAASERRPAPEPEVIVRTLEPEVVTETEYIEVEIEAELPEQCRRLVEVVQQIKDTEGEMTNAAGLASLALQAAQKNIVGGNARALSDDIETLRVENQRLDTAAVTRAQLARQLDITLQLCEKALD